MIIIDGQTFDIGVINITRKGRISRKSLGTTQDGVEHIQTVGTYCDYEVTFATRKMNVEEYDKLYELVTTPTDSLMCTFPYGQTTFEGSYKIDVASDRIVFDYSSMRRWSELKVTFEAITPKRISND